MIGRGRGRQTNGCVIFLLSLIAHALTKASRSLQSVTRLIVCTKAPLALMALLRNGLTLFAKQSFALSVGCRDAMLHQLSLLQHWHAKYGVSK